MANVSSFSGAMPVIPGGLVELGYSQITSNVTVAGSSYGTTNPTTVIPALTVVCDGSPVIVEFWAPYVNVAVAGGYTNIHLVQDGTTVSRLATLYDAAGIDAHPVHAMYRITPSAGSHTFAITASTNGTATASSVAAGSAGGAENAPPTFLRISKILQPNNGLKPFWTPPIVTQLPTNPSVGDQVIYAADATNGVYWKFYYDGLGTYPWKFIGGSALGSTPVVSTVTTTSTTAASLTGGPSYVIPLAGDYRIHYGCGLYNNSAITSVAVPFWNGAALPGYGLTDAEIANQTTTFESASAVAMSTLNAAGNTLELRYRVDGGTGSFTRRFMQATPVRVKAA